MKSDRFTAQRKHTSFRKRRFAFYRLFSEETMNATQFGRGEITRERTSERWQTRNMRSRELPLFVTFYGPQTPKIWPLAPRRKTRLSEKTRKHDTRDPVRGHGFVLHEFLATNHRQPDLLRLTLSILGHALWVDRTALAGTSVNYSLIEVSA